MMLCHHPGILLIASPGQNQSMTSDNEDLVQLDDVLTQLRANAKAMARDLISGVEMTRTASKLLFYVALLGLALAIVDLVTIPLVRGGKCCYTITYFDLA